MSDVRHTDKKVDLQESQKSKDSIEVAPKLSPTYQVTPSPYLPPQINVKHLGKNGLLLSDTQIKQLQEKKLANGRHEKDAIGTPYHIIKMHQDSYALHNYLDAGSFGIVFLAQHLTNGSWHVAKLQDRIEVAQTETQNLVKIDRKVSECIAPDPATQKDEHILMMPLERGIKLSSLIESGRKLPPAQWIEIAISLMELTSDLHQTFKLFHRDLKPGNIIYDQTSKKASIIDLGLSVEIPETGFVTIKDTERLPRYSAPEVIRTDGKPAVFSEKSETFNLGETIKEFCDETRIPHKDLLSKISTYLKRMTHEQPEQRPTLDDCKKYFAEIRADLLQLPYANVGILDEADFLQCNAKEQQNYLRALKYVDETWLVDTNKTVSYEQHISVQRTLEAAGINTTDEVLHASKAEHKTVDVVTAKCADTDAFEKNKIHNYFYITRDKSELTQKTCAASRICTIAVSPDKKKSAYKKELTNHLKEQVLLPRHRGLIIETLQAEIDRLTTRYRETKDKDVLQRVNQRIDILKENKNQFLDGKFHNYHLAFKQLEKVQNEMMARTTSKVGKFFSHFFKPHVGSATKIKTLTKEVKAEILSSRFRKK